MQQHKEALDRVVRVRHMVAMIAQPRKAASLQSPGCVVRTLSLEATCLKMTSCQIWAGMCCTQQGWEQTMLFSFPKVS